MKAPAAILTLTPAGRRFTDNGALSGNGETAIVSLMTHTPRKRRAQRVYETHEFAAMMSRMIRAHRRRVALGSTEDLADLIALRAELDAAIDEGALALHSTGVSWTEIGDALGVTRQAARQRFARIEASR